MGGGHNTRQNVIANPSRVPSRLSAHPSLEWNLDNFPSCGMMKLLVFIIFSFCPPLSEKKILQGSLAAAIAYMS